MGGRSAVRRTVLAVAVAGTGEAPPAAGAQTAGDGYRLVAADGGVFAFGPAASRRGRTRNGAPWRQLVVSEPSVRRGRPARRCRRPARRRTPDGDGSYACEGDTVVVVSWPP